jgi:hypothetical protein
MVGFDASEVALDISGFKNNLGSGHFSLSSTANDLSIRFSAVPEPAAMLAFFAATLIIHRRPGRRHTDRITV